MVTQVQINDELEITFCTNVPELVKLSYLYAPTYMYLLWITNVITSNWLSTETN